MEQFLRQEQLQKVCVVNGAFEAMDRHIEVDCKHSDTGSFMLNRTQIIFLKYNSSQGSELIIIQTAVKKMVSIFQFCFSNFIQITIHEEKNESGQNI